MYRVGSGTPPLPAGGMAPLSTAWLLMARFTTAACSFWNRLAWSAVMMARSGLAPACTPNSPLLKRLMAVALALTWYCRTVRPSRNTALPALETQVNMALLLEAASMSPMRPPQPAAALLSSVCSDCQVACWSLCENSLTGTGTLPAWYWASVSGWIRVPTLATTAARPASNSCLIAPSSGCRA